MMRWSKSQISRSELDSISKFKTDELGKKKLKFDFVLSTVIWHEFLSRINIVSKVLQSNSMDFGSCLNHLQKLNQYFTNIRTNESSYQILYEIAETIAIINIQIIFLLQAIYSIFHNRNRAV